MNALAVHIPVAIWLYACFFLLACGQLVNALIMLKRYGVGTLQHVYEFALVAPLAIACPIAQATLNGNVSGFVYLGPIALDAMQLLLANVVCAVLAVIVAVLCRDARAWAEAVLLACCTPPIIALVGDAYVYVFIVEAGYFLYRTVEGLANDLVALKHQPSLLSCVDALDVLPEGVLYADDNDRVVFMNNRMRSWLSKLGAPTDLSTADAIATFVVRKGTGAPARASRHARVNGVALEPGAAQAMSVERATVSARMANAAQAPTQPQDPYQALHQLRMSMPDGVTLLFDVTRVTLRGKSCRCITAADVTEEELLNAAIVRTNALLAAANRELSESLADVREVARADAVRRMRSRVHDTIGQKLSILHCYLEKDNPTPEELARVKELLRGITEDITEPDDVDPVSELAFIVDAFALVGCAIVTTGALPADDHTARACVDIVREAATNAVKHGQAARVNVAFSYTPDACTLTVSNNGAPAPSHLVEGLGLPGMRQAAREAGGTLVVISTSPFALQARFSLAPAEGTDRHPHTKEGSDDSHSDR